MGGEGGGGVGRGGREGVGVSGGGDHCADRPLSV